MLDRRLDEQQGRKEGDELADREHAMLRLIERNADDACDGNEREDLRDGRRDRAELERLEAKPADAVVDVRKAPFLEVVGVAYLDEASAS